MDIDLHHSLNTHFGFSEFRPGQARAVAGLLAGSHVLAVMPTGAGKSLIFQLAALELGGSSLVISPLIALMKDQVDALQRRGIPATFINSAIPQAEQNRRLNAYVQGSYRIIYVAPERLRSVAFLEALQRRPVRMLAVDEAHCVSEWGHDFRPDYLNIAAARAQLGSPLTAALTATATTKVQEDIIRLLGLPESTQRIVTGFNRTNLSLNVLYTVGEEAKLAELERLIKSKRAGAALIYAGTRRNAEIVSEFVNQVSRVKAQYYHAGLAPEERARIQEEFMSGRLNVITATNAFGMGIDRPDVRQVIHFSLPGSLEAYYQEVGRAGRDGQPARTVLLYDPRDRGLQEYFIKSNQVSTAGLNQIYQAIRQNGPVWTTLDDLSRATHIDLVGVRVALSALEQAGALEHLRDEGLRLQFRKNAWDDRAIAAVAEKARLHTQSRQEKLSRMVAYAESNECRRKIVLRYFGDSSDARPVDCCDNCRMKAEAPGSERESRDLAENERVALMILDALQQLKNSVGKVKLIQILRGSRAKDILQYHYDRSPYYARLAAYPRAEIEAMLAELTRKGYLKLVGGDYPVLHLTPRGQTAAQLKEAIPLGLPRPLGPRPVHNIPPSPPTSTSAPAAPISAFLNQPHPRSLSGSWNLGWALDFHSHFSGSEWNRSETGQLTDRLKHQGDLSILSRLVELALALLAEQPALAQVDALIPVPPSSTRPVDPVRSFCSALARRLKLPLELALVKTRSTEAQKALKTRAQKYSNVAGAFSVQGELLAKRVLVVDDLLDSGATMEEVTRVLKASGVQMVNVLTLTRTIHSDH